MVQTVDMHCDTMMKIYRSKKSGSSEHLRANTYQIDQEKLMGGRYLLQNFALFIDQQETTDTYQTCKEMAACFYEEMQQNQDWIQPVTTYDQILQNKHNGKISALLTMEEGAPITGDPKKLREFYDIGVRMMTLTWNYPNEIGFPNAAFFESASQPLATKQLGLTDQGILIVAEMEKLGMIIDVSHGSDQLVEDVLANTKKPFVASHSNARAICDHFRNLPDELIKKIADRGGVIGMNYCRDFLLKPQRPDSPVDAFVAHVNHFRKIGGVDCIGLGSDFDGIPPFTELADASTVGKLYQALDQAGYSTTEIEKIFSLNVLRLYKELL